MTNTKLKVVVPIIIGMMIAPLGMAQGEKGVSRNILETFMPPKGEGAQRIAKELGLDTEQRAQMKEVNSQFADDTAGLRQSYQEGYRDVVSLMNSESPDKGKVNSTLKTFHKIHADVVDAEVRYWMDLKTILNPEQNLELWGIFEKNRIRR